MATSIQYLEELLQNKNIQACNMAIRVCEGTDAEDGYNYLFGSTKTNDRRFTDFSTHPNLKFPFNTKHGVQYSTAAGAAQILNKTYRYLCSKYGFSDFTPHTQDLMFLALYDDANVLTAISKGWMLRDDVLAKLSGIWASLPLAKYGQPTHTVASVRKVYQENGGVFV